MRKLTKKQIVFARKEFSVIEANILESGGKRRTFPNEFELQTVCGTLYISLDIGYYIFSINCRFAEVKRAADHFKSNPHSSSSSRLNPFSGKWNFNGTVATDLVTEFFIEINPLLNGLGTN